MGKRQRAREARQNRQTRQAQQTRQERPTPPPTLKTELHGKTPGQISVLRALKSHNQVIITGPAGTGKTYMTAGHAALALKSGAIRKIILTRPNVPAEEQRRLRGIYRTFAGDRDGNFPDGEASTQIGARSSLM